jgi:hypothetical protein
MADRQSTVAMYSSEWHHSVGGVRLREGGSYGEGYGASLYGSLLLEDTVVANHTGECVSE